MKYFICTCKHQTSVNQHVGGELTLHRQLPLFDDKRRWRPETCSPSVCWRLIWSYYKYHTFKETHLFEETLQNYSQKRKSEGIGEHTCHPRKYITVFWKKYSSQSWQSRVQRGKKNLSFREQDLHNTNGCIQRYELWTGNLPLTLEQLCTLCSFVPRSVAHSPLAKSRSRSAVPPSIRKVGFAVWVWTGQRSFRVLLSHCVFAG